MRRVRIDALGPFLSLVLLAPAWQAPVPAAEKADPGAVLYFSMLDFLTGRDHAVAAGGIFGPFRVRLMAPPRTGSDPVPSTPLVLAIDSPPWLIPVLLRVRRDSLMAAPPGGQAVVLNPGGQGEIKMLGESPKLLPVPLPGHELGWLKGEYEVLAADGYMPFRIPRLAAGIKQEKGGMVLTLDRLRRGPNPRHWNVDLTLQYPAGRFPFDSYQTWVAETNRLVLRRRQTGDAWLPTGEPEISVEEGGRVRITYRMVDEKPGPPRQAEDWQLEYEALAAPSAYPLKFTFSGSTLRGLHGLGVRENSFPARGEAGTPKNGTCTSTPLTIACTVIFPGEE